MQKQGVLMKNLLVLLSVLLAVGCSPDRQVVEIVNGANGRDGTSCSVSDYTLFSEESNQTLGAMISCTDGSSALILNGQDGKDGINGLDGLDGENGIDGVNGIDGQDGKDGLNGEDGKSCSVKRKKNSNYATIKCGKKSVKVYDGTDGTNGQDGTDGTNGQDGTDGTNGQDGTDGTNGQDGTNGAGLSLTSINLTSSCKIVDGNNSAKLNGSSGEAKLYSTSNCSGSSLSIHDGEVAITSNGNIVMNVAGTDALKLLTFTNPN
jgi:hypothetical protein